MSRSTDKTFMARAALFASPKDSSVVPKKRVAREGPLPKPLFSNDSTSQQTSSSTLQKTPDRTVTINYTKMTQSTPEQQVIEDDVEPMEVDTSVVPSPQRPQESTPRGDTPCSSATTPRRKSGRKSMPTPGKRLFFTSKDTENEERVADETTQLELLMANVPEDMDKNMKAMIVDKQEMDLYSIEVLKEIKEFEAVRKTRETMLANAREITSSSHISSVVSSQIVPFDLTFKKEETPDQIIMRLHNKFLKGTKDAAQQRKGEEEALVEEEKNKQLKSHIKRMEELEERKEKLDEKMSKECEKAKESLKKIDEKFERVDKLMRSFEPLPIF